jgi:hypothetical protein
MKRVVRARHRRAFAAAALCVCAACSLRDLDYLRARSDAGDAGSPDAADASDAAPTFAEYVQGNNADITGQSPGSIDFLNVVGAHDAIVVAEAHSYVTGAIVAVTDDQGDTFTQVQADDQCSTQESVWFAPNVAGGQKTKVTIEVTDADAQPTVFDVAIYEYSGISTFEAGNVADGVDAEPPIQTPLVAASTGGLLFGFGASLFMTLTPGPGFSLRESGNAGLMVEDLVVDASGTYAVSAVGDPGGDAAVCWVLLGASFKP